MSSPGRVPRRVFLSHTSELRSLPEDGSYVAAAESAIHRAGDAVVDMAYFGAGIGPPAATCREKVLSSDLYLVVAGFLYGSPVSDRPDLSHVEFEYEIAGEAGLPRLAFLLDDRTVGPPALFIDPLHGPRQRRFRERLLRSGLLVERVSSPQQLETAVLHALQTSLGPTADGGAEPPDQRFDVVLRERLRSAVERLHSEDIGVRLFGIDEVGEIVTHHWESIGPLDLRVTHRNLCRFVLRRTGDRREFVRGDAFDRLLPDVSAALALVVGEFARRAGVPADLSHSDLRGADLLGAWLTRADLRYARLDEALLAGAGLRDADLSHAGLGGAQLMRADLTGANLDSASFAGADLTDADLGYAHLASTDFSTAILDGVKLSGAFGTGTRWPDGFRRDDDARPGDDTPVPDGPGPADWVDVVLPEDATDLTPTEGHRHWSFTAAAAGSTVRLTVLGEVDSYNIPMLRRCLLHLAHSDYPTVQVDLRGCEYYSFSPGAGLFFEAREVLLGRGADNLQVLGGDLRHIVRGFTICGLYEFFDWRDE